jgi:hypothetical protein
VESGRTDEAAAPRAETASPRAEVGDRPVAWLAALFLKPAPAPPRAWVWLGAAILSAGTAALGALLIAGYVHYRWPAHHLQDYHAGTYLCVGCLAIAGFTCIWHALQFRTRQRPTPVANHFRFWTIAGVSLLWLAADDMWRFHERFDHAIHALFNADPENPWTERIDDAIVLLYGALAAIGTWRNRALLLRVPWAARTLAIAFLLYVGMAMVDSVELSTTIEDSLKILSTLLILIGCLAVPFEQRPDGAGARGRDTKGGSPRA